MKAHIVSHDCITSLKGSSASLDFTRNHKLYLDGKIKKSPFSESEKVELDFEQFGGEIVYFSLVCKSERGTAKQIIFFGTRHGDRVYTPETNSAFESLIMHHKTKASIPTWIKNL